MFHFATEKAIQSVGVLFDQHSSDSMEYLRLLKLLYIADRTSLKETGYPIVGNRLVAMKYGPLHHRVYDLIKGGGSEHQAWAKYFKTNGVELRRIDDPGVGGLSKYEVGVLQQVRQQYEHVNTWELVEVTHEFEEWRDAYQEDTTTTISYKDVLTAVGREDEFDELAAEDADVEEFDRMMGQ